MRKLLLFIFLLITPCFAITKPTVNATSAIAIDTVSGRILYEKNAFSRKPMASTTKIMTAIIAVEKCSLDDIVTISKKAAATGGSNINLKENQQIKLKELLYGLMLASGNDAAVAIAEHTAGSVEEFSKLMNEKAIKIGAFNTNFVTPHGLDNDNHYSTAYDMAIIAAYALKNPTIKEIVGTKNKYIHLTDGTGRNLNNTNALLSSYEGADGVKTGYTSLAGRCLVASATRDNWQVISVVFGEPTSKSRISDSINILNYSFNNFTFTDLRTLYKINFSIPILQGIKKSFYPIYENELLIPLTNEEKDAIKIRKNKKNYLTAPIIKNANVGEIEFVLKDEVLGKINLICENEIKRMQISDYFSNIAKQYFSLSAFK